MNSPEAAAAKSGNLRFILPLFLVIILIAAVGYIITTQTGVDKKMVEEAVKGWETQIEAFAKSQGSNLDFTYEKIEMKGQGAARHAVLINPTFDVRAMEPEGAATPEALEKATSVRFTTAKAELIPQSLSMDHVLIRVADPITFEDHDLKGKLTADAPIHLDVEKLEDNKQTYLQSNLALPTQLVIESMVGEELKDKITLQADKDGKIALKTNEKTNEVVAFESDLANVKITDIKDESLLTIAQMDISTHSIKQESDDYAVKVLGDVKDVMTNAEDMPYGAFSAAIDMTYDGPLPAEDDENFDWSKAKAAFALNKLNLVAKDTSLEATANFKTAEGELLPVGKANIKVMNLAFIREELEKQGVLDKESEMLLGALVLKITDQKIDDVKDLNIDISREAKGSLKVGKSNFEDLFAIVLTGGALAPKEGSADAAPEAAPPAAQEPLVEQPQAPAAQ